MNQRVMLAPDSFKGSLTAREAASAMAKGLKEAGYAGKVERCPLADGGEGFLPAIQGSVGGKLMSTFAEDALGRVDLDGHLARWLWSKPAKLASFELAEVAGLTLLDPKDCNPMKTTTRGVGEMIAGEVQTLLQEGQKVEKIMLGIGGSATNDGGCGAAQALGVRFMTETGDVITQPIRGGELLRIAAIDCSKRTPLLNSCEFRIACDVTNPFTGPDGASRVYAPQKGATPEDVEQLEAGMVHLAELFRRDCGVDVENLPGAGAAGGFGGGAVAMLGATLEPGMDLVFDAVKFESRLAACDLCITGEGCLDGQSQNGKVVGRVLEACKSHGVPCVAVAGALGDGWDALTQAGLVDAVASGNGLPEAEAMAKAAELVTAATKELIESRS